MVASIQNPLVSIIMPTYNYARFLPDAINSIQNQTFKDYELVVYYDHSKDNSLEILQSFSRDDPRINIIEGKERKGAYHGYNTALANARGKYIFVMDSDNTMEPELLQKSIDFLQANNDITMVTSIHKDFSGKTRINAASHDVIAVRLLYSCYFCNAMMARRDFFEHTGLQYDQNFAIVADYNLFIQSMLNNKYPARFAIMDYHGINYRIHGENLSLKKDNSDIFKRELTIVADNISKKLYAGNENYKLLQEMMRCNIASINHIKSKELFIIKNLILWRDATATGLCSYQQLNHAVLQKNLNRIMRRIAKGNMGYFAYFAWFKLQLHRLI